MYVEQLIHSFKTNYIQGVQEMIRQNRKIIQKLDSLATIDIETNTLRNYVILVRNLGASKTSGAGGGDCGITIVENNINKQKNTTNGQKKLYQTVII